MFFKFWFILEKKKQKSKKQKKERDEKKRGLPVRTWAGPKGQAGGAVGERWLASQRVTRQIGAPASDQEKKNMLDGDNCVVET